MADNHTPATVKAQLQADIAAANAATNASDTTIHGAIQSLISGFGTGSEPILQELIITKNGEYTPPDGIDGFSKVIADIVGSGGGLVYDMGEFVLDGDHKSYEAIPHKLGETPDFILVWTDALTGTTNEYGTATNIGFVFLRNLSGLQQRCSSAATGEGLTINLTQPVGDYRIGINTPTSPTYTATNTSGSITSDAFNLHIIGTNTYYRGGITYKYFVSKAWWDTCGGAANA